MEGPAGRVYGGGLGSWSCHGELYAAAVTVLLIVGSIDDPADLAPIEGAGAHETGFYGDIDGGVGKIFAAQEVVQSLSRSVWLCPRAMILSPMTMMAPIGISSSE
jgi:hypothetical protein